MLATPRPRSAALSAAVSAIARLRRDYPAWAARCYRIRDKHGKIRPLTLNDAQRTVGDVELELLRLHGQARLFVLKARQGGFSTDQQARALHQIWAQPNFDALTLAHTREDTEKLFAITTRAVEHFPPKLLPTLGDSQASEISFPGLDALFFTGTAGAKRTGRGMTIKRFHGSEFAFWDDPEGTLGSVTPGLVPAGSVVVLETTASGYGSAAHLFWQDAKARGYTTLFFPWWECDRANYRLPLLADDELGTLEPEERDLVERRGLDLEQIKWRRMKMAEMTRATFLTEYAEDAETCWASPGGMFYDVETLKALMLRKPTPTSTEMGGALQLFAEAPPLNIRGIGPKPERVIIGCDVAEGLAGDRSTWVARAFPSWRLLAKFEDARTTPEDLAGMLNTWGRRFGMALLVVEKNAHGITVLRKLRDVHAYPTSHIYHRAPLDSDRPEQSERIGWHTNGESKPILLDSGTELLKAAKDGNAGVPSEAALKDAFAIRRDDKGKVDTNGKDVFVAECLAWIGRGYSIGGFFLGRA